MALAPLGTVGDNPAPDEIDWRLASDEHILAAAAAGIQQAVDEAKTRGLLPFTT